MTPQTAYLITEQLARFGHMLAGMRKVGISLHATPEALNAIRECGHPDALWVAMNLMAVGDDTDAADV